MRHPAPREPDVNVDDLLTFGDLSLSGEGGNSVAAIFEQAEDDCVHGPPTPLSSPTQRGNTAWVVFNGRPIGDFETWVATSAQVNGYCNSSQQGFPTREVAQAAWVHALANHTLYTTTCSCAAVTVYAGQLSDEEAYWVVLQGARPGVYHGRAAAMAALGFHNPCKVLKAGGRPQADHAFAHTYMAGDVFEVYLE
ncbi:hypothetical protein L208DRAFT_1382746 [Tricholoma matsutake]|nr:hypothetical protein L208DRAFT_1382746 [Tricholoma matsutake 945]